MSNNVTWLSREELDQISIDFIKKDVDTLLDIGAGIQPKKFITPKLYICCEPFSQYVDMLHKNVLENPEQLYYIVNYDWEQAVTQFPNDSIDTVFLIDVIEHLEKNDGERLLEQTEKLVNEQIAIFTPLGFIEQHALEGGKDAWGLDGAGWQEHKSGWMPEDFDDTWTIFACKEYHTHNNINEKLEQPHGAFWAIKNMNKPLETKQGKTFLENKQLLSLWFNKIKQTNKRYHDEVNTLSEELKHAHNKIEELQTHYHTLQQSYVDLQNTKTFRLRQLVIGFLR